MSPYPCFVSLCALLVALPAGAEPAQKTFALKEALHDAHFVGRTPEQAVAQLNGKRIIGLYFTARWCKPCRIFSPELVRFRNQHRNEFQFVMMSRDKSLEEQQIYLEDEKMDVPAVRFDDPLIQEAGRCFQVEGVPTLLIFDGEGNFITRGGREQLTLAIHPSDLEALGNGAGAKAWREMIAPNQEEALKVREAELAGLAVIVEKHKDFPRLQEIFSFLGFYGKSREIDRLIAQIGRDIAADWDRKQGCIDEMVVLAAEFKPGRRGDIGLFVTKGDLCFDELGKQAAGNARICDKLEGLLSSAHPYARQWGLRGLVKAAVAGNEQAFQKVTNCESLGVDNAPLGAFRALKADCDAGNPRALDLALRICLKEPDSMAAAMPVFVNAGHQGHEKALDAMAEFCRSGRGDCKKDAMFVLTAAADNGSAYAKQLLGHLEEERVKAADNSPAHEGATQAEMTEPGDTPPDHRE